MHKFPLTKVNLLITKKRLQLATLAQDLLDKKKKALLAEYKTQKNKQKIVLDELSKLLVVVEDIGLTSLLQAPLDTGLTLKYQKIMGVPLPQSCKKEITQPFYSLAESTTATDEAFFVWQKIKTLFEEFALLELALKLLADEIKKAHKGALGLEYKTIPECKEMVKQITNYIEEYERDELIRLNII